MSRSHLAVLGAAILFLGAGGALADDPPAPAPAGGAPAAAPAAKPPPAKPNRDDEVVCKTIPEPGSRLGGKRTCMTRREWDQMSADARDSRNHGPPQ